MAFQRAINNNCYISGDVLILDPILREAMIAYNLIRVNVLIKIYNPILECLIDIPSKYDRLQTTQLFCQTIMGNSLSDIQCDYCDCNLNNKNRTTKSRVFEECWLGMVEFIEPVIYQDEYIGSIEFGQFLTEPPTEEKFERILMRLNDINFDYQQLHNNYFNARVINKEEFEVIENKIKDIISTITSIIDSIIEKEPKSINLIRGNKSLINIVGISDEIVNLKYQISQLINNENPVLIRGESGTGKELVARAIHATSSRNNKPLIVQNAATIPEHLIESELFGYKKGAFTDAKTDKAGLFETANGGTLFLDEIGNMSLNMQSKILRIIEDGFVKRIGDNQSKKVDVRLITATNADIEKDIQSGKFRNDLYYRINTNEIYIPPLRERKADLAYMFSNLLSEYAHEQGKVYKGITEPATFIVENYSWLGNVRELKNEIRRIVSTRASGGFIDVADLSVRIVSTVEEPPDMVSVLGNRTNPLKRINDHKSFIQYVSRYFFEYYCKELKKENITISDEAFSLFQDFPWRDDISKLQSELIRLIETAEPRKSIQAADLPEYIQSDGGCSSVIIKKNVNPNNQSDYQSDFPNTINHLEKENIIRALLKTGGNKAKAARILNFNRQTFYRKIEKYNIDVTANGKK